MFPLTFDFLHMLLQKAGQNFLSPQCGIMLSDDLKFFKFVEVDSTFYNIL